MGWLSSLFDPEPRASYAPWDNFWYQPPSEIGSSIAGYPAGEDAAMRIAAFFNAVRILSETVAQAPLILYERTGEDQKEVARNTRLYTVLHDQPNQFQSSYEWRLMEMMSVLLGGNSYSEIIDGTRGAIDELNPLLCGRMTVKKLANGRLGYLYRVEKGQPVPYTQDEIFHVRGFPLSSDGVTGMSILSYARETIGTMLAAEAYGARLYKNDARRFGNFSVPGNLKPEQRMELKKLLREEENLILEAGATWVDRGMTPQDIEFLISRKFGVIEIARFLNIQPHLLKDLERATFSNIEHQGLEFLQFTMMPYFVNWEQAILRDLIVQKSRFFAEFLVDGLVRADIKTRYEAYGHGINTGFMTRNQARLKENWNRIEGLDAPLVDQNKAMVDKKGNIIPINKPEPVPGKPDVRRAPLENGDDEEAAHYRRLFAANAERVLRKEVGAMFKALGKFEKEPEKLNEWADSFYANHGEFVAEVMQIDENKARKFAEHQRDRMLLSVKDQAAGALLKELEMKGAGDLIDFVRDNRNGDGTREAA